MEAMVRIVVVDISSILGAEVYDELLAPVSNKDEVAEFLGQYTDITKYRIITV